MLLASSWLHDYVFLPDTLTGEELATTLTEHVVEVEGVFDQAASLDHIVVGKIISLEKHPDADRLTVCQVEAGTEEPVQIVCGGTNLSEGMLVALGNIGAKVQWHGEGELVELKKTKIRGVTSLGMICGADEIGLADHFPKGAETEILDLSHLEAAPGTPLSVALSFTDLVVDIDNKSMTHRPDLWGHYGMARELAAIYRKSLKELNLPEIHEGKATSLSLTIENNDLCPRYTAIAMDNITIGPSPAWLQQRLLSVGIEPINNIVDITNYVMFDIGQPMHAFDGEALGRASVALGVRNAKAGETFTTLDEEERELTDNMLLITNNNEPIALAGIMGGAKSAVHDGTTSIVLESANFDAVTIRRATQKLGLRTDASARFEKSLDPTICDVAIRRAVALIKDVCPEATVSSALLDTNTSSLNQGPITVSHEFIVKRIGVELETKTITDILTRLGFEVSEKKGVYTITVPTWRATKDVSIKEDIVEEIARIYGYNNIEAAHPTFPIDPAPIHPLKALQAVCREVLVKECAMTEMQNYSFVSKEQIEQAGDDIETYLELDNPVAKDKPYIRRYMVHGLLENIKKNQRDVADMQLFEIGRTFVKETSGERATPKGDDLLPQQRTSLGMAIAQKGNDTPFFTASAIVQRLYKRLGITIHLEAKDPGFPLVHPGRYANIMHEGNVVGRIGEVHPKQQQIIGLEQRTAIVEIDLETLVDLVEEPVVYQRLAQYPSSSRDISVMVDRMTKHADMLATMLSADGVVDVTLLDVYTGDHVEDGKKSMTYRVVYQSATETLTTEQADTMHVALLSSLEKKHSTETR